MRVNSNGEISPHHSYIHPVYLSQDLYLNIYFLQFPLSLMPSEVDYTARGMWYLFVAHYHNVGIVSAIESGAPKYFLWNMSIVVINTWII